ncbi:hypothetical protein OG568_52235 (plasmid) [Streptomyces sp. NBC_01450]|uniref:hypothetical protein n=1 Tax=Streptomyces sp. NBC_01450 TaxID=2903871 RepID=UPI002E3399D7|nr:hypothetical protein [Streptomyces sp. NBC_01450]
MLKKILSVAMATTTATAAFMLSGSPASAAPLWCGSWLKEPSQASNISPVNGTQANVGGSTYIRVNQGSYGGKWYAWAKMYNYGFDNVALIWINQSDKEIYQCGNRDGVREWAQDYTAGVDDAHAYKVQAKYVHSSIVAYGPTVFWR